MNHTIKLPTSVPASRPWAIAVLAAVACTCWASPRAAAQSPPASATASPSASATAAPSASAAAAPDKARGTPVQDYAWPTDPSPEPKEEEWAGATELTPVEITLETTWWGQMSTFVCAQRAVREWVRATCTPPHDQKEDVLVGVMWSVAGDLSTVKGKIDLASTLPRYKNLADPTDRFAAATLKMGASATITFQARPGSAFIATVDRMGWAFGYEDSSIVVNPGILVDVSWAVGEKAPSLIYH